MQACIFKYSHRLTSQLYIRFETNILQKQFNITCLTSWYLAFEFNEKGNLDPTKTIKMEYRFLVDYTMTPP